MLVFSKQNCVFKSYNFRDSNRQNEDVPSSLLSSNKLYVKYNERGASSVSSDYIDPFKELFHLMRPL